MNYRGTIEGKLHKEMLRQVKRTKKTSRGNFGSSCVRNDSFLNSWIPSFFLEVRSVVIGSAGWDIFKELHDENYYETHDHEDNKTVEEQAGDEVRDAERNQRLEELFPIDAVVVNSVHYFSCPPRRRRGPVVVFFHSPFHDHNPSIG